jgi:hypothetical protein
MPRSPQFLKKLLGGGVGEHSCRTYIQKPHENAGRKFGQPAKPHIHGLAVFSLFSQDSSLKINQHQSTSITFFSTQIKTAH